MTEERVPGVYQCSDQRCGWEARIVCQGPRSFLTVQLRLQWVMVTTVMLDYLCVQVELCLRELSTRVRKRNRRGARLTRTGQALCSFAACAEGISTLAAGPPLLPIATCDLWPGRTPQFGRELRLHGPKFGRPCRHLPERLAYLRAAAVTLTSLSA
jgi:hypothetical protein